MIERSIENIELTDSALLHLVQRPFPNCRKIEKKELLSGGALNTTYMVQVDGKKLVLRIYVRDRMLCSIEKEVHALIDGKVATPKLLYSDAGHEPWAFAIFEYIPGVHITEVKDDTLSYTLGRVLGSIHSFKLSKAGLFGEKLSIETEFQEHSSPYYEETVRVLNAKGFAYQRLGEAFSNELLKFMHEHQDFFPKVEKNKICLVHSDFKPVNLLYHAGSVFVLDWEFAHAGLAILDFAILLRHRTEFACDLQLLEQGYVDAGCTLAKDWFRSALITDFVNIVQLLDTPAERPQLFVQLKNALRTTMDV